MATSELATMLERRQRIIEIAEEAERVEKEGGGGEVPVSPPPLCPSMRVWNPYNDFLEFTRKEIQHCQKTFNT